MRIIPLRTVGSIALGLGLYALPILHAAADTVLVIRVRNVAWLGNGAFMTRNAAAIGVRV